MKFARVLLLMVILAALILVPAASAAPDAPNARDFTVAADDISVFDDSALNTETPLVSGGSSATGVTCISQYITYLKFDLRSLIINNQPSSLSSATLTLRATGQLSGSTSITMKLWGSNTDSWTEGAGQILWASKPGLDSDLNTQKTGLVAAGSDVVFNTSAQFVSFLQQQLNTTTDGIATIAIETIACNAPAARQYMASRETTGANAVPARLTLNGTTPTAVDISAASATRTSLPLYAGLGAVALFVVAGVMISRRRTA
jgi:hypothetical protein